MKVSCVISIHNRTRLFAEGLKTLAAQAMPAQDWELIVVDDMSTENIRAVMEPYRGKLKMRHVAMEHTRHPIFKDLNPNWREGQAKNWWHTPALSYNLGIKLAKGEVVWITQPEVLQHRTNAAHGYKDAMAGAFGFVNVYHDDTGDVRNQIFAGSHRALVETADIANLAFNQVPHQLRQEALAQYWFSAFIKRETAMRIEGVREIYLRGAAAEDDDFRERCRLAGAPAKLIYDAVAVHLFHGDEKEFHHRRDHGHWQKGLEHNRGWYYNWLGNNPQAVAAEQIGCWGDPDSIVGITEYPL